MNSIVGLVSYRHIRSQGGGWQIEEQSARSGPRGPQRRTTRLWLWPDWTVLRAEMEVETDVGREYSEIIRSNDGTYRVRITQPDGYISDSAIASAPLLPSERLAFSVLPQWLALQAAPVAASLLGIEQEVVQVAERSCKWPRCRRNLFPQARWSSPVSAV